MTSVDWVGQFRAVYERAVAAYAAGARTPETCVAAGDLEFLASIGCSAPELFDFVEDVSWAGEPSYDEAFGVAALRREYLLGEQGGRRSTRRRLAGEFPSKSATLAGVAWLPRIIAKAEAKLRGELPPDLMYGCGGDRDFLGRVGIGLTEFLRQVRDARGDTGPVVARVTRSATTATPALAPRG